MTIDILELTSADLEAVDELMKHFSRTLGFLPKEAIKSYLEKGSVLGAKNDNQRLVGYLLYADRTNYFRITHLCVLEECQGQGIARQLVNRLKLSADTQKSIRLNCRRDYPANEMWPKLGFVPLGEKPSRSKVEHTLTFWQLTISPEEQLELFRGQTSTDTLDVIIDAQIFFDFEECDSDKTIISKALFSDFLADSLELWITDEMYTEINRQEDQQQRKRSQNRAQNFPMIEYSPDLVDGFVKRLKCILSSDKPSGLSTLIL